MRFQNTEGQWIVQLTINNLKKEDTLVTYKLEVENSQGKNEYEVRLETDNEPGPGMFCHLSLNFISPTAHDLLPPRILKALGLLVAICI